MKALFLVLALAVCGVSNSHAAAVVGAKHASGFTGKISTVEVTWDRTKDAGTAGALDLLTADQDLVILRVVAKVKVAGVGASGTYEVGKLGDTAGLMAQTDVASVTLGAVIDSKVGGYKLASGEKIIQTIATTTQSAGKITYWIEYTKF